MKKLLLMATLVAACGEPGHGDDEQEVISAVQLTFMPAAGLPIVAEFDDPDGDGGGPGTSEPVNLAAGASYTLTIAFINRLGTVPEDITVEVRDEGDEHQVFFTGNAVKGPATANQTAPLTHSYADMDANGFPIGLTNTIATEAGTGTLTVTLRHMPPESPPEKSADTATQVKNGGFTAIGGATDASVDFTVTVQ
jgi:hypothetical protein